MGAICKQDTYYSAFGWVLRALFTVLVFAWVAFAILQGVARITLHASEGST